MRGRAIGAVLVAGALVGVAFASPAAAVTTRKWLKTYDSPAHTGDTEHAMVLAPDGSAVFVTGASSGDGTVAYDATTGKQLWTAPLDGIGIAVTPDGSTVVVIGTASGQSTGKDIDTIAYDAATGDRLWEKFFNDDANGDDAGHAVTVTSDGHAVVVTGGTPSGIETIAYDATTGDVLWDRSVASATSYAVGVSPDSSTVVVTGTANDHYLVVAYNASTGHKLWMRNSYGTASSDDWALGLAFTPDSSTVVVTGQARDGLFLDWGTVAYSVATGQKLWDKMYGGRSTTPTALPLPNTTPIAITPDGSTAVVAGGARGGTTMDFATVAYDTATGAKKWARLYNGPGNGDESGVAVAAAPDGSYVAVTGASSKATGASDWDMYTAAYDPAIGRKLWDRYYDGSGSSAQQYGYNVAIAPDSKSVYVSGTTNGAGTSLDYTTIDYALS